MLFESRVRFLYIYIVEYIKNPVDLVKNHWVYRVGFCLFTSLISKLK